MLQSQHLNLQQTRFEPQTLTSITFLKHAFLKLNAYLHYKFRLVSTLF